MKFFGKLFLNESLPVSLEPYIHSWCLLCMWSLNTSTIFLKKLEPIIHNVHHIRPSLEDLVNDKSVTYGNRIIFIFWTWTHRQNCPITLQLSEKKLKTFCKSVICRKSLLESNNDSRKGYSCKTFSLYYIFEWASELGNGSPLFSLQEKEKWHRSMKNFWANLFEGLYNRGQTFFQANFPIYGVQL